jgi:hypothetical protein
MFDTHYFLSPASSPRIRQFTASHSRSPSAAVSVQAQLAKIEHNVRSFSLHAVLELSRLLMSWTGRFPPFIPAALAQYQAGARRAGATSPNSIPSRSTLRVGDGDTETV